MKRTQCRSDSEEKAKVKKMPLLWSTPQLGYFICYALGQFIYFCRMGRKIGQLPPSKNIYRSFFRKFRKTCQNFHSFSKTARSWAIFDFRIFRRFFDVMTTCSRLARISENEKTTKLAKLPAVGLFPVSVLLS